jgi:hypothetical protein
MHKSRTGTRVISTDAQARQTHRVELDDEQNKKDIELKN